MWNTLFFCLPLSTVLMQVSGKSISLECTNQLFNQCPANINYDKKIFVDIFSTTKNETKTKNLTFLNEMLWIVSVTIKYKHTQLQEKLGEPFATSWFSV